jgi:SAM-dependent methyltransferase
MLELQPDSVREQQDRHREEYMANRWDTVGGREQTRLFAKYFLDAVRLPPAKTLLDISCAKGDAMPEFHSRYPHLKLFGSDISERAIGDARNSYGSIAQFEIAPVESLSGFYDIIYCSNTLEHFGNNLEMARTMLAHCRILYILTPYRELAHGKPLHAQFSGYVADHVCTFDKHSFDALLGDATSIKSWVRYMPGAWGTGRVPLWRRVSAFVRRKPQRINARQIIYELQSRTSGAPDR